MATELETVQTALANARTKLAAALTGDYSNAAEFKPGAPGNLDRVGYIRELRETIAFLADEVNRLDPYEISSEAWPS